MDERVKFVARGRAHGGSVPRVRDLAQDWLQDLRSLSGMRHSRGSPTEADVPIAMPVNFA
jgi:hypothetical protein